MRVRHPRLRAETHFGVQARTMKIIIIFGLRLRLRSPFGLKVRGYVKILRLIT